MCHCKWTYQQLPSWKEKIICSCASAATSVSVELDFDHQLPIEETVATWELWIHYYKVLGHCLSFLPWSRCLQIWDCRMRDTQHKYEWKQVYWQIIYCCQPETFPLTWNPRALPASAFLNILITHTDLTLQQTLPPHLCMQVSSCVTSSSCLLITHSQLCLLCYFNESNVEVTVSSCWNFSFTMWN